MFEILKPLAHVRLRKPFLLIASTTMTTPPDFSVEKPPSSGSNKLQSSTSGGFNWLNHLSIATQISCGYLLVFSVTVVGISTGFIIGDYYTQPAREQKKYIEKELFLLYRLQSSALQVRLYQQRFSALTQKPNLLQKEYSHFLRYSAELNQVLFEVKSYVNSEKHKHIRQVEDIPRFLFTYKGVP